MADFLEEGFVAEGFLEEIDSGAVFGFVGDFVFGVARDEQDRERAARFGDAIGQLPAGKFREHEVGDEDVDVALM